MGYEDDRAEFRALEELEDVLARVAEELAVWRRRALSAEKELKELGVETGAGEVTALRRRIVDLDDENAELERRVQTARKQVSELVRRLTFLEQQTIEGTGGRK